MQDMPEHSVDLIYLDPPFNSARNYNAIYKDETGRPLPDHIEAFCDIWQMNAERERAVKRIPIVMREAGIDDDTAAFCRIWLHALRTKQPDLLAYLSYMIERLLIMKRLLKPSGSMYLHCDPTASHYLKVMMDMVFGVNNFRNEIVWGYRTGGYSKRWFGRKHDIILFYTRSNDYCFHGQKERSYSTNNVPPGFKGIKKYQDEFGRWYTMAGMRDVWEINAIGRSSKERLGYATQKPLELLERIIAASSNAGDIVLDPFCGCATTIEAAHKLGRNWIGIDIAIHAIKRVAGVRLEKLGIVEGRDYTINGVPHTLEGARDLWVRDPYHFQKWAVEQVDGFVTAKRTVDGGIDGRLYFTLSDTDTDLSSMIIDVKGGKNVGIDHVRSLRTVLERDSAKMAGLIVLEPPSNRQKRNFQSEMAQAGDLDVHGVFYPRMQMLTVEGILAGQRFHTPSRAKGHSMSDRHLPMG